MSSEQFSSLRVQCPFCASSRHLPSPHSPHLVRHGFYYRASDSKRVARFFCVRQKKSFSHATFSPCFGQKKRRLNEPIRRLLCSGVSQRRIAKILKINRKTVIQKFLFLAREARLRNQEFLEARLSQGSSFELQFDEMESSERSKCLPVSIPLVVEKKTRKILAFGVCEMPAKGLLAKISLQKYGPREDQRREAARKVFKTLEPWSLKLRQIESDQKPSYPSWIRAQFPDLKHRVYLGKRGCIAGQGELKKIGFDPLFDFNHTAAMLRANINRLFRRTWCTTKKKERLEDHIAIYAHYHNSVLTV